MPISSLPTPPTRSDPVNFNSRADAFMTALPTFANEANALQADVNAKQAAAATSAANALASENAANASSNASVWVSGTTYAVGNVRYSPITYLSYRRKTAGAGTTDPSADSTNWQLINGTGNVDLDSTQTLTNKTFSTGSNWNGNAIPIANGGTGSTTAVNAFNALKQNATESATGVVELATTVEAADGTASNVVVTPAGVEAHMQANALGWGQTYLQYDSTARATGTIYQNTTGRPILVSLWGSSGTFELSSTGTTPWLAIAGLSSNAAGSQFSVIVLPGWYYRVTGSFNRFSPGWVEIR